MEQENEIQEKKQKILTILDKEIDIILRDR